VPTRTLGLRSSRMKPAEVSARLQHYRGVERQWAENLFELDEHATYRLLAAGEMAGKTGSEANAVLHDAPLLWGWLGELRSALDEAEKLNEQRNMFGPKYADRVTTLLAGPAIELRRSEIPTRTSTALRERFVHSTVGADLVLATIDTLIALFRSVYEPVRAVVADVDAVWRDLMPRIDAANISVAKAEAIAARLEMRVPEVQLARQRLDAVKSSVSDDPLGLASNVGPGLDALVADAARAAGELNRAHGSVDADADATAAILADLRVLRARAAAAYSEAQAKISGSTPLVPVPSTAVIDGPNGLAHRAARIGGDERAWQERRADLDDWHLRAQRLRSQLERALDVNTKSITDRNEMRGLLQAYRAKATMTPGLSSDVLALGDDAHHELFTSPTDLARARELIAAFSAALSV